MTTSRFRTASLGLVLVLGLLPVACSRKQVFKPAGYKWPVKNGQIASWKQGILPDNSLESNFEVYTDGIVKRQIAGRQVPTLLVHYSCTNRTGQELTMDGAQSHVLDNRGRLLKPAAVVKNGAPQFFARLKPQSHGLIDVFYDVPKGFDPKSIGGFTAHWRYTVGGEPYTQAAVFNRGYVVE